MIEFRLFNIPIRIHPSFFILLLLFSGLYREISFETISWTLIMVFSLLVHELGHGLAAQRFGANPEIHLESLGGLTLFPDRDLSDKQRFLITLSGPLLESILIVVPYFILQNTVIESYALRFLLVATMKLNIYWCLLNLIPVDPLDGGKIARHLLQKLFGQIGLQISLWLGITAAFLIGSYLLSQNHLFFGSLLLIFGFQNIQIFNLLRKQKQTPFSLYTEAQRLAKEGDLPSAKSILRRLIRSKDQHTKSLAAEALAQILHNEHASKEAYHILSEVDPTALKSGKGLLCRLAFEAKNYALVAKFAREIYELEPTYEVALLNSKAFAGLHMPAHAGGWLQTASLFDGIQPQLIEEVLKDPIYDTVKNQDLFHEHGPKLASLSK